MAHDTRADEAKANLPVPMGPGLRLPRSYGKAKEALAKCIDVDECKHWQDRAAALASYAQMAKDDDLFIAARRLQAQAARRCGELLKKFDARPQNASKRNNARGTLLSQKEAATRANLSKRQKDTYLRIASMPEADFKAAVEGSNPPTLSTLAKLGTKSRASPATDEPELNGSRLVVRRALEAMRANNDLPLDEVEPSTRPRKAFVRVMERYPLEDISWPKMLLGHMSADGDPA